MNKFVDNVAHQEARTLNNMKARASTASACVDLFFHIGALRGQDVIPTFVKAFTENKELALRIALWARDVRGGAGERKIFRDILQYLEEADPDAAYLLLNKTPEVGRWDDLLVLEKELKTEAFKAYAAALEGGNGLAAKWAPRKGPKANSLRKMLHLSPKEYRKLLVKNTNVVETQMCSNKWEDINFSHVPSRAASIYKKAFDRHTPKYKEYVEALVRGDEDVKINASAIYPHDVIKECVHGYGVSTNNQTLRNTVIQQWNALPDYMNDKNALALVDVSGSMYATISNSVEAIHVSVSLGLYIAEKTKGAFKDTFLTFSSNPELLTLRGDVVTKLDQMCKSKWGMSTDLHAALEKILSHAIQFGVPQEDMPEMLLILSDMQFNQCVRHDHSAMQMIEHKYINAGYKMPQVVFWNLVSYGNVPVEFDKSGVALVSGFSPSILKSVLTADVEAFTPETIMLKTIMNERYDLAA
jgi:hypothetical protein